MLLQTSTMIVLPAKPVLVLFMIVNTWRTDITKDLIRIIHSGGGELRLCQDLEKRSTGTEA